MVAISPILVTCIVPVHNSENYIEETLDSIFSQSYPCLEVIIVDDGSTDATPELLKKYSNQLTFLRQKHSGPSIARNLGLDKATGGLIAFLDSDDLWEPDKISLQVKLLTENSDIDACFTQVKNFWMPEIDSLKQAYRENSLLKIISPYHVCSLVARASVFNRVGVFNPNLRVGEDADFFRRMKEARIRNLVIPQNLVKRRLHKNNISKDLNLIKMDTLIQIAKNSRLKLINRIRQKKLVTTQVEQILSKLHHKANYEDFYCRIANSMVRLRFTETQHVLSFTRSFKHLLVDPLSIPERIDLNIIVSSFDGKFPDPTPLQSYVTDDNIFLECGGKQKNISILNLKEGYAYHLLSSDYEISQAEMGAPFCRILRWWYRKKGLQIIHGAVVGFGNRGILIPGRGGSGKSTISIACLEAGLSFLSDDFCLLELNSAITAYSLYSSAKLFTKDLGLTSTQYDDLENDINTKKSLFFIDPTRVVPKMSIEAICLPVIQPSTKSELIEIAPFEALRELAASTLFQMKGSQSSDLRAIENLVKRVPCYRLSMGSDLNKTTEVIKDLLSVF